MDLKAVEVERDGAVEIVRLNRPHRLNAWTDRMGAEYRWALERADADPDVRVIVVTGAGRGFCAGADLQALDGLADSGTYPAAPDRATPTGGVATGVDAPTGAERSSPAPGTDAADTSASSTGAARADFDHPHTWPLGLRKPVIAAVNGPAAGVGFVLMCFTDIRFAAAGAKLTTSFARLGLPAEHGVTWMLSRLIGPARAADLLFSSRIVLAEEAAEMGLVNRVLPPDELLPFVLDYARTMAAEVAPSSLAMMKRQIYADLLGSLDEAAGFAYREMVRMVGEADFAEGVAAFQAKRPPKFHPLP